MRTKTTEEKNKTEIQKNKKFLNTVDIKQMLLMSWIQTSDLWCQEQPLCQLNHNHCPKRLSVNTEN